MANFFPIVKPRQRNKSSTRKIVNGFIGLTACQSDEDEEIEEITETRASGGQVIINGFVGCICKICKEFYQYAEPNMSDGTLVCYKCRNKL